MKAFPRLFCGALLAAAAAGAPASEVCQKCTHDMQVQYRKCLTSGKSQDTCSKEQQTAAQVCVAICQKNKAPDEK